MMEESADFEAQVVESLEIASTLRRSNRQWVAELKTEALFVRLLHSAYSSGRCNIAVRAVATFLVQGFILTLLGMGASAVIRTQMSPGQLLSCFTLTAYLTGPASGRLPILKEVDATFRQGELTLLRGESGCGKSSVF